MTASGLFTPEEIGMVRDYFDANSDEALKLGHRDLDGVKKELLAEQLWFVRSDPEIIKEAYESRKDVILFC